MKYILKLVLMMGILMAMGAGALAADIDPALMPGRGAQFTAEVIAETMNCYAAPGEDSRYLGRLGRGAQVDVISFSRGWAKIRYHKRVGYAKVEDMASNRRMLQYVNTESVPVYWEADIFSESPGTLEGNQRVWLVGVKNGYWLIENDSGTIKVYIEKDKIDGTGLLTTGESRTSNIVLSYK